MENPVIVNATPIATANVPNSAQIPADPNKKLKMLLLTLFVVMLFPLVYFFMQKSQTVTSNAAPNKCQMIKFVEINPRQLATTLNANPTGMSALAYDFSNKPIFKAVNYHWGISSNNGIGNLKANQDLANFYPLKTGMGDIYVNAKNACTKKNVTGSIGVVVNPGSPSATETPKLKRVRPINPFN